jgi:DNA-binding PadR family transcriptional regulator
MRFFHHPHHAGRHGGHAGGFFGFGPHFGEGFGPEGGGRGFGPGRKLGSADLQLLLLALLAEKPSHGYELIKAVEERSNGYYTPSPGMVYPALTYLEEIGHASVAPEGTRKLYSATDVGRKYLADNRSSLDTLLAQLQQIGRRMQRFRRAMQPEPGADEAPGAPELQVARYDLKLALTAAAEAPREQQLRIAAILRQAAADIRGS